MNDQIQTPEQAEETSAAERAHAVTGEQVQQFWHVSGIVSAFVRAKDTPEAQPELHEAWASAIASQPAEEALSAKTANQWERAVLARYRHDIAHLDLELVQLASVNVASVTDMGKHVAGEFFKE